MIPSAHCLCTGCVLPVSDSTFRDLVKAGIVLTGSWSIGYFHHAWPMAFYLFPRISNSKHQHNGTSYFLSPNIICLFQLCSDSRELCTLRSLLGSVGFAFDGNTMVIWQPCWRGKFKPMESCPPTWPPSPW